MNFYSVFLSLQRDNDACFVHSKLHQNKNTAHPVQFRVRFRARFFPECRSVFYCFENYAVMQCVVEVSRDLWWKSSSKWVMQLTCTLTKNQKFGMHRSIAVWVFRKRYTDQLDPRPNERIQSNAINFKVFRKYSTICHLHVVPYICHTCPNHKFHGTHRSISMDGISEFDVEIFTVRFMGANGFSRILGAHHLQTRCRQVMTNQIKMTLRAEPWMREWKNKPSEIGLNVRARLLKYGSYHFIFLTLAGLLLNNNK